MSAGGGWRFAGKSRGASLPDRPPGPDRGGEGQRHVADPDGLAGCLRVAVQCDHPKEEQFIDLADQSVAPGLVEHLDRRLPYPIRVVGYGELRQRRFDQPAGDLGVAAESEQGEAKAFPDLEQLVGLVPDLLGPPGPPVLAP